MLGRSNWQGGCLGRKSNKLEVVGLVVRGVRGCVEAEMVALVNSFREKRATELAWHPGTRVT